MDRFRARFLVQTTAGQLEADEKIARKIELKFGLEYLLHKGIHS